MISVTGLRASYRGREVLHGVDLEVAAGGVTAVLGPNGAGKTTTVRVLATLLRPDAGRVVVAGRDARRDPGGVRCRIGLTGQFAAVDERLTGRENLETVGRLQRLGRRPSRAAAAALLERFDLVPHAEQQVRCYSGGMRRRLDIAASLVADPQVLFLDEPTTGLDPSARAALWVMVREVAQAGTTVLLTTQYLEEADQLAGDVVVVAEGRVVAQGSPEELKRRVGAASVTLATAGPVAGRRVLMALHGLGVRGGPGAGATLSADGDVVTVPVGDGVGDLAAVLTAIDRPGLPVRGVTVTRPSLDDVYFAVTGRGGADDRSVAS